MKKNQKTKKDEKQTDKMPYEAPVLQYTELQYEDVIACSDMSNYTEKALLIDPDDLKW